MPTHKKRADFFTSEDGLLTRAILKAMATDTKYHTVSSYSTNSTLYEDNLIPFVDKHMAYLRDHPSVDPDQYISNLRLITKIR